MSLFRRRAALGLICGAALVAAAALTGCAQTKSGGSSPSPGGAKLETGPGVTDTTIKLGVLTDRTGPFAGAGTGLAIGRKLSWDTPNTLRPISSPLPAPANGPVRSVSTPSLMVVSVTPGPVSSFAPPGDGELPPDLVCAHPVSAAAATGAAPEQRHAVLLHFGVRANRRRSRLATPATPPGSKRSRATTAAP